MYQKSSDPVYQYCENHTTPAPREYNLLERETHMKTLYPQMISGPLQGRFLSMISKMIQPKNILEIGTFTGYGTLCLGEGLDANGKIFTIDINNEISHIFEQFVMKSSIGNQIEFLIGNALDIIPTIDAVFDLVFIDAHKPEYIQYYESVFDKVRPGGYIIADNVLWSGRVVNSEDDATTNAIQEFNLHVLNDGRVEQVVIPMRDGISLIRKLAG